MDTTNDKISSLNWAIGELSKQKDELEGKLKVARKRDETSALIEEVHAQKDALEKRIASLQDGLRVSSDLVDDQVEGLAETISTVDEKLEIAQERLEALEQEEYLEELGRKLNGDYSTEETSESSDEDAERAELVDNTDTFPPSALPEVSSQPSTSVQTSPTPVLMKSPSNRIETEEEETTSSSRITPEEGSSSHSGESKLELCQDVTASSLEECAKELGMEPEYLLNKGMQAVLRMIARNGNQISFPLEVEQVK
ncbi:MAG: hypothetical protein HN531_00290 [Opitutae bacterium]|nr:hypothetical protein [Opitutae bacterium]